MIRFLRLWIEGAEGHALALGELRSRHGASAAERLAARFGDLLLLTTRNARRPLLGHAEGAREEAILMAALIVRADLALALTTLAEEIGLGLMRGPGPRILQ